MEFIGGDSVALPQGRSSRFGASITKKDQEDHVA